MTENALWSILNQVNAARGGEWIETRLLAAGPRSNPWFHECGDAVIAAGDFVSFDTDMIGPYGYCADVSRSFLCGDGRPSDAQRRLYGLAWEQIHFNLQLLRPGLGFRELAERSWRSEEHTSELQSLMRISYAVFCLKKKKKQRQRSLKREQSI